MLSDKLCNCFSVVVDSNIPETGEQLERSIYSSSCCFRHCAGHELCVSPAGCQPRVSGALAAHCDSSPVPTPTPCASANAAHSPRLSVSLFALLLIGHLIDQRCRKRTKVSWKQFLLAGRRRESLDSCVNALL